MIDVVFRPAEPPKYVPPVDLQHDLVVLPREIADDGTGLYDDSVVDLVKQLRAEGVDAAYMHDADHREWIGEKAWTPTEIALVISVAENLASSAAWDGLKMIIQRAHGGRGRAKLKVCRVIQSADGTTTREWIEVEGEIGDVVKAIDGLRAQTAPLKEPE